MATRTGGHGRSTAALGLIVALVCSRASARADEPDPVLRACGLPADYLPPWGLEPVPVDEQVPGAIGLGAIPRIGCPPAPPGPGEPDVRISNLQLAGSPYREPTRRSLLADLAPIRGCYFAHSARGLEPALKVALTIASDGTTQNVRVIAPRSAHALRRCVAAELATFRGHGSPTNAPSLISFRYYVAR